MSSRAGFNSPGRVDRHEFQDSHGRTLTIRALTALDQLHLYEVAGPELSQNEAWLGMACLVYAVTEINGVPTKSPDTVYEIEAAVAELGSVGLRAVSDTLAVL